jgi:serine/threonine protein kinase
MMIDHYVVYDLIGMGSYGSVYRGMDDHTKKEVAVKLINMRQIKGDKNEVVRKIKLRLA